MRLHPVLLITFLAAALAIVEPASAAPSYTLTVNPSYPVTRGTTMTLTLSLAGGTRNSAYNVLIGVTKPNGTGQANVLRTFSTDNRGVGGTTLDYPDPSFTSLNGTVATDVGGVYTVQVNQTSPSFQAGVASAQFTVIAQLTRHQERHIEFRFDPVFLESFHRCLHPHQTTPDYQRRTARPEVARA